MSPHVPLCRWTHHRWVNFKCQNRVSFKCSLTRGGVHPAPIGLQMILGMLTLAVRRELIPCRWWCAAVPGAFTGSIPAWAGEPSAAAAASTSERVYPRVGGGTLAFWRRHSSSVGLSPRGRGNRVEVGTLPDARGSIPAWAGEPPGGAGEPAPNKVYPRVGGGTTR